MYLFVFFKRLILSKYFPENLYIDFRKIVFCLRISQLNFGCGLKTMKKKLCVVFFYINIHHVSVGLAIFEKKYVLFDLLFHILWESCFPTITSCPPFINK